MRRRRSLVPSPYTGTANDRAKFAARVIRSGKHTTRAFDTCFEMGDADEVIKILREMAKRGPKLRENWPKYLSTPIEATEVS